MITSVSVAPCRIDVKTAAKPVSRPRGVVIGGGVCVTAPHGITYSKNDAPGMVSGH